MTINTYLSNKGYHIEINTLSQNKIRKLIDELTVVPYRLDATPDEMETLKFTLYQYDIQKKYIIVPRYYGISRFGKPLFSQFDPEEIDIEFTQNLRPHQQIVVDKCIDYILNHGGGLLSVPCGFGKTVCALYIAHRLGLKTLVVVHKSCLINQWVERIKEYLNVSDTQIGIIQRDVCSIRKKDIVVGMIHTISKREYDIYDQFGLVIYDEAHHVACKFFSRTLLKTGAQYTLALTATPYRGDGLIKVMYWFVGGTIYREELKINKNIIVKMFYHRSNDKKLFIPKKKWIKGAIRSDTGKMTTNICNIATRNNKIVEIIDHIRRNEPERKILVLSNRKNHLDEIKKNVDRLISQDIERNIIEQDEILSCLYTGDTKPVDRSVAEERGDIIFATFAMANEGLDIKHLNTIILATPKKDIVQSIGRIMRKILKSGDIRPMIIDIGDDLDVLSNWINIRNTIYKKCKYEIEDYYIMDNKFVTSIEYHGMKLTNDDVHHKNMYINKIINTLDKDMNDRKNDIDSFIKLTNYNDVNNIYDDIDQKEYPVLDDLEYDNLNDILHVKLLTDKDFDVKLVTDNSNKSEIDLYNDECQKDEPDDNMFVFETKKPNVANIKKLF